MAKKDESEAERKARYERIGKASAKTIKNVLAGTPLAEKLRAKGFTWVPEKKESRRKMTDGNWPGVAVIDHVRSGNAVIVDPRGLCAPAPPGYLDKVM